MVDGQFRVRDNMACPMVKINLLPSKPEPAIYRKPEITLWIVWLLSPFAIILWAKVGL
jgi:hypothetical protein